MFKENYVNTEGMTNTVLLGENKVENTSSEVSTIAGSVLSDSSLEYATVFNSNVLDSKVKSSVIEKSHLEDCDIRHSDIYGATLLGVKASYISVHRGVWKRPPISMEVETSTGRTFMVTECVEGRVDIDCMCHTVEKWLGGAGARYLRMRGFTPEDVVLLTDTVKEVMNERDEHFGEDN